MFSLRSNRFRMLGLAMLTQAAITLPSLASQKLLTNFASEDDTRRAWVSVNDSVMGGVSKGGYEVTQDGTLVFAGDLSLKNNGGFTSIRTRTTDLGLAGYDTIVVRVKGDGRTYNFDLRTAQRRMASSYRQPLETKAGEWIEVSFPIEDFYFTSFGRRIDGQQLRARDIASFGFTLSDKEEGEFRLEVGWVKATTEAHTSDAPQGVGNIVDVAAAAGQFNTLLAAAKAAGLVDALQNPDASLTVFAPTDEAFAALPEGTVASLLKPENKQQLVDVLTYHVLPQAVTFKQDIETLQGQRVSIETEGTITVAGATVVAADIQASNGVIHVIDRVLLPPAEVASPAEEAMQVIALAIERGVPQFNNGNVAACVAIYEVAAASLLSGHSDLLPEADQKRLQTALKKIDGDEGARDQAWMLRRALDSAYESLAHSD